MMRIMRLKSVIMACLCALVAGQAYAFKIDTHLWLADNLYNRELRQGRVYLGDTFGYQTINERAYESLKVGRNEFLIGVLGADLYPDMIVGQMTTHPGMPLIMSEKDVTPGVKQLASVLGIQLEHGRGWQTDDWLNHVLVSAIKASRGGPSKEIAFAYGYLLHAAMDTWAHTYVNMYTGDLFSLTVNQETAARHTAIEGFIKNQHQKYLKKDRRSGEDNLKNLRAPTRFVRDTLILNRDVANQYAHQPAAIHLWAMYALWETSKRKNREWLEIRDQLDIAVNRAAQKVLEADSLWRGAEEAKQIAADAAVVALTAKQKAESEAETASREFNAVIDQILSQIEGATRETVEQYMPEVLRGTYEAAKSAFNAADQARRVAVDEYSRLANESTQAGLDAADKLRQLDLRKAAEVTVQNARRVAWKIVADSLLSWRSNIELGVDRYIEAWEMSAREIMREPGDRFSKGHDVIWPLTKWTKCWGPIFLTPSLPMSLQVVGETCGNIFEGFKEARENLDLHLVNLPFDLLGMPQLKQKIVKIDEDLEETIRDSLPVIGDMIANGIGVVQMAPVAAGDISVDDVQGTLRGSASFVAQMWEKDIHFEELNDEFAVDGSGKNLPLFDARDRDHSVYGSLMADKLPISPNAKTKYGFDDMMNFKPIHNAIMLSRLTFLDGKGLNKLATQADVMSTSFTDGKPAYGNNQPAGTVLIGAIRSIDGNHQWQPVAPVLPRNLPSEIRKRATDETCRRFGYPFKSIYGNICYDEEGKIKESEPEYYQREFDTENKLQSEGGFRLWMDPKLRKQVFNKIFLGPLSPALCEKNKATIETLNLGIGCDPDYPFPDSKESRDALVQSYPGYMDTLLAGVTPTVSAGMAGPTATATAPTSSASTTTGIKESTTSIVTSAPAATTTTTTRIQSPTSSGTIQQTAPTVTTALATVSRVTPASSVIYPGQRVIITLEGRALNTLSAVRIRQSGRDVPGFRTTMEPASTTTQTRRRITVEAASTAAIGNYQLAPFAGRQIVAVPRGTVVAVVAPRTILQPKTVLEPKTTILPTR